MSKSFDAFIRNEVAPARNVRADSTRPVVHIDFQGRRLRHAGIRPVLVMIWRTSRIAGRLECCWTTEQAGSADERASCSDQPRRAA